LFPKGRVSARQAKQLTCWSDNVLSLEVEGSFDDCQTLVKAAFADADLAARYRFSSANSINIGRLLPQSTYYAYAALDRFRETGRPPGFIVPTGNLGNALACVLARDMGLPIGDIVLATNANRLIGDYLEGADWLPRASLQTLATAMDVGNPSNMERLRFLHGDREQLSALLRVECVTDAAIEARIRHVYDAYHLAICPHTATAFEAWERLDESDKQRPWVLVSTAHAAKFESVVEPLIGETIEVPPALAAILERPSRSKTIPAKLAALDEALQAGFDGG
ncbi:MAG: pyridoxal-phosphate dependent enzyme, partial [Woeseiaceae bacterium]|nr:pyridoxal-phosphate dependent enzyme [Woeseiaceae bacterium]